MQESLIAGMEGCVQGVGRRGPYKMRVGAAGGEGCVCGARTTCAGGRAVCAGSGSGNVESEVCGVRMTW